MNFKLGAVRASLPILLAGLLVGCSSTPKDETAGMSAEKLYADAKEEAAGGAYDKASKLYEKLEGRGAGTLLSQQAQIELAYAQYKMGEKATALATIDRFIKLHPTSPALDYAFYLRGLVNFNDNLGMFGSLARQDLAERDQQASRDAFQSFKQLVDQFPQSQYAPDARARMNYIVNSLAAYEVHVARYYYTRGAYIASVNRAQQTVKEFQQSPSAEEALVIMVQSYDKLGLEQLRDDTARVLKENFPDGALAKAQREKDKPWWQVW
ncbi:outer membrane protein assembly factor BamD [soil metagenome]